MSSSPSPSKNKPEIDKMIVYDQFTNSCIKQRFVELCEKLNITPQYSLHVENESNEKPAPSSVTIKSPIEGQYNSSEERNVPRSQQSSSRKRTIESVDEYRGGSDD